MELGNLDLEKRLFESMRVLLRNISNCLFQRAILLVKAKNRETFIRSLMEFKALHMRSLNQ